MYLFTVTLLFLRFLSDVFIANFKHISRLDLLFSVINFKRILSCLLGWAKVNKVTKGRH